MAIDLVTKFSNKVDEQFAEQSKTSLVTNNDYNWNGAKTVKVYTVNTVAMNDYDKNGSEVNGTKISRYGDVKSLDATTKDYTVTKDRSFTFAIDKLDNDETQAVLEGATALARQQREVVIPEVDSYVFNQMTLNAGTTAKIALTEKNIYNEILKANEVLDDNLVPESNRILVVTPSTYVMLKKSGFIRDNEISQDMLNKGVVAIIDGLAVMKVPKTRLPKDFGFMVCHPVATVAPVKLEEYKIHEDPPYISGSLVEGRIAYDAFVLENKKKAIYYASIGA